MKEQLEREYDSLTEELNEAFRTERFYNIINLLYRREKALRRWEKAVKAEEDES